MRYLLTGFAGLLALGFFYSCQKELSVEYGSAAKGRLQSSAGDCLPKTVNGAFTVGKGLNDTNYIDVTVNVTSPGPYKIATDTLNGYAFVATGTFAATGSTTVRLKGAGTPVTAGTDLFTVFFDSSFCDVEVTVLPAGSSSAAVYTLGAAGGACTPTPFTPSGNYVKDTALNATNFVTVTVNVTAAGTYSINTAIVNGYFFSAAGTFGATGTQTVKLFGSGKPVAAGTDNFTVTGGASTCTFSVTCTTTAPASCNPNVQGTYTAGTAATTANTVTLTHTYASAGSVTVSTNTVNGYSFGPSTIAATAGVNTITLTATGTPASAGTDNFTVTFGDGQTCSFSVTVTPVLNTDYFPTTQGTYWTYNDSLPTDTFKVAVAGTTTFTGNAYQNFNYVGFSYVEYYRKDASNGYYWQSEDTAGWGPEVIFTVPRLELNFLKNSLSTGANWKTDFTALVLGSPGTLRLADTCVNANASITVNGKSFTGVYEIKQQYMYNNGNGFLAGSYPLYFYYAKGVGLILVENRNHVPIQGLRYWMVN